MTARAASTQPGPDGRSPAIAAAGVDGGPAPQLVIGLVLALIGLGFGLAEGPLWEFLAVGVIGGGFVAATGLALKVAVGDTWLSTRKLWSTRWVDLAALDSVELLGSTRKYVTIRDTAGRRISARYAMLRDPELRTALNTALASRRSEAAAELLRIVDGTR